jgi:colanic acid/amylovoran biosynthesis protein
MGLSPDQVAVTGDEAIELAYGARASVPGDALGINLRVAHYADVDASFVDIVRPIIQGFAEDKGAPLLPVPITIRPTYDPLTLRQLLAGYDDLSDGGESLNTPMKVIEQASRCRIVVAGAYHAAVFSLAQGIPTVCLARSSYYIDKFLGLQDLFGAGCQVVMLSDSDFVGDLKDAMEKAWNMTDDVRSSLCQAAARQCSMSENAYEHFGDLVRSWDADNSNTASERPISLPLKTT